MKFNNRQNIPHEVGSGKIVWESRSVAVNGVILATIKDKVDDVYILCSERGPASADFQGFMNLIAGYLDWDETATDAFIRETWEEVGLNIIEDIYENPKCTVLRDDLSQPWHVASEPDQNRQNVSLRFGLIFEIENEQYLPTLSLEHNEIVGEVKNPMWLPLSEFGSYSHKWAFNHDKVIVSYLKIAMLKGIVKLSKD